MDFDVFKSKSRSIEGQFLEISVDINRAIQDFVQRYESQYRVVIRDYVVGKDNLIEGTYFLAGILRLNFTYEKFNLLFTSSVIIKVPQLGEYQLHGEYLRAYQKEKYFYETVLPLMYQKWPVNKRIIPNFYGCTDLGVLVLENLKETGYYQKPNGSLLDLSACKVVLKALAQFHALSIKTMDSVGATLDSMTVLDKGKCDWAMRIHPAIVQKLRIYVLPFCSADMCAKFEEYVENLSFILRMGQMPNEGGFNVLIHGDFHLYNLLLKDNERNKVAHCKLIDFQYCRRGSPILDVILFLVTSVECQVVEKNWKSLFSCYVYELNNVLKKVDPDRPCQYGINDLMNDFEKYKLLFIYPLITFVPFYWVGTGEYDLDLNNKKEKAIDTVMKSGKYISFFKGWITHLLSKS